MTYEFIVRKRQMLLDRLSLLTRDTDAYDQTYALIQDLTEEQTRLERQYVSHAPRPLKTPDRL
jgi:hypothetical protein